MYAIFLSVGNFSESKDILKGFYNKPEIRVEATFMKDLAMLSQPEPCVVLIIFLTFFTSFSI